MKKEIILASRSSLLARIQCALVAKGLKAHHNSQLKLYFLTKETKGDQDRSAPLWQAQDKGLFTNDLRELLLGQKTDLVVHSYKDLPLEPHPETEQLPVLERADQRDILLFRKSALRQTPQAITILTSSPRRLFLLQRFLKKALPYPLQGAKLYFESIRGNVPTRIKTWLNSKSHGLVLAKAGLDRLLSHPGELLGSFPQLLDRQEWQEVQQDIRAGLEQVEFMVLPLSHCPNAPAQGSLAVEIRKNDSLIKQLLVPIGAKKDHLLSCQTERQLLTSFGGGCRQKIGIACLRRSYGTIYCIHGEDKKGKPFAQRSLDTVKPRLLPSSSKNIWPLPGENLVLKRKPLPLGKNQKPREAWISRSEAWPKAWLKEESILWAAGTRTLFRLAERGIWVNGCAEGLGEKEEIQLDALLGRETHFIKLSPMSSEGKHSRFPILKSYEWQWEGPFPDLRNRMHFFWKSSSQFHLAVKHHPEIRKAQHSCGPGLSFERLQQELDSQLSIYLDYDNWLATMIGK